MVLMFRWWSSLSSLDAAGALGTRIVRLLQVYKSGRGPPHFERGWRILEPWKQGRLARRSGIADPGCICISSSVYDQIAGKLNLGFVDIGEKALKNISRPIRVYRFDRSGEFAATPRRAPSPARAKWVGGGVVAALVLAAVAVWRSGILEPHPPAATAPSTAAGATTVAAPTAPSAAPPSPAEAASEETKLKLKIAEAERAKAEAELARSRADAEAAKQRARSERKESLPASLAATAPAAAARTKALPGSSPNAGVASGAVDTPTGSASVAAQTPAASSAMAAEQSAATASPLAPVNATGSGVRFCDAWEEFKSFNDRIPARVADGEIVLERGEPGQPGYLKMSGRPTADGHLSLFGTLVPTIERLKGREVLLRFDGTYANGRYTMSGRQGTRNCTMIVRLEAH